MCGWKEGLRKTGETTIALRPERSTAPSQIIARHARTASPPLSHSDSRTHAAHRGVPDVTLPSKLPFQVGFLGLIALATAR